MNARNAVWLPALLLALAGCSGREPNAHFSIAPSSGPAPLAVQVEAADRGDEIVVYRWDFGDGNKAQGPAAAHTYAEPGQYTLELAIGDRRGRSASQRQTVQVAGEAQPPAPAKDSAANQTVALAKTLIAAQGCGSCHALKNADFNLAGAVGPDLSLQAQRGRSRDWLLQQLQDPTSIPDAQLAPGYAGTQTVMPSYGRLLSSQELDSLVSYLLTLGAP